MPDFAQEARRISAFLPSLTRRMELRAGKVAVRHIVRARLVQLDHPLPRRALAAAEVIQHIGARPQVSLKELAQQNGLPV